METNQDVLASLVEGQHKCSESTCGCSCGTTYAADGKAIISSRFPSLCQHVSDYFDNNRSEK